VGYDHGLAQRVREHLVDEPGLSEREMFGGIGFMLDGNMAAGVIAEDLLIRVGPDKHDDALSQPHTRVFDMTGRSMRGWVVVAANALESDETLAYWLDKGRVFARSLPAK
jgi:TfoX/Sxy family transcriptional regulator of competence genes